MADANSSADARRAALAFGRKRRAVGAALGRNWLTHYCLGTTALAVAVPLGALILLVWQSLPAWRASGAELVVGVEWHFREAVFGALPMIYGSATVALIALLLAAPLGIGAAIFTSEYLSPRLRFPVKSAIELLAGVPSVVYGLLAVLFLREWMDRLTAPLGAMSGDSLLTAGVILAAMVLPTIATLADDALRSVGADQRMAARGLGLTRSEIVQRVALTQATPGLVAAVFLGLGRAIGETIAVFLVVGRMDNQLPDNPFSPAAWIQPGQTLTSKLGGPETHIAFSDSAHFGAILSLALMLFAMTLACLGVARAARRLPELRRRSGEMRACAAAADPLRASKAACPSFGAIQASQANPDAAFRWRLPASRRTHRIALPLAAGLCGVVSVGLLIAILATLAAKGAGSMNVAFLFSEMRAAGAEGGVAYQVVGTLILVLTAAAVALPLALAVAVFWVVHLRNRPAAGRAIDDALQLLNGVPSIVFGIVGLVFFFHVLGWGKSWLAGGVVLGFMILPTVTVAFAQRLAAVPSAQTESAVALGLRRDQIIRAVWLPQSWTGLFSGLFLGLARAAGETAPILFVAAVFSGATFPRGVAEAPVAALPYHIFTLAQDTFNESAQVNLWGAALTLVCLVAAFNLCALPVRRRLHEAGDAA